MKVEVLASVMNASLPETVQHMNLQSDAVIINQCDRLGQEEMQISPGNGRIRFCSFPDRGIGRSRNEAILRAEGDICLFSDADIVYEDGYEAAVLAEHYGLKKTADEPQRAETVCYHLLSDVPQGDYRTVLDKLIAADILRGRSGTGEERVLDLTEDSVRLLVLLDRAGVQAAGQSRCKIRNRKQKESGGNGMDRIMEQLRAYRPWNEQEEADCAELLRRLRQGIYRTRTVDTTAAGDTFTGYFVACMAQGRPEGECLDLASRAAAIAVSRPGAAPSIPVIDEVLSSSLQRAE